MPNPFQRATRRRTHLRMAIYGPSGAGKTYTALRFAKGILEYRGLPFEVEDEEGRANIAFIDTEHGSASLYANLVPFDTLELDEYHPRLYMKAIDAAMEAGYQVLIIDSLSHAWVGKSGALDLVELAKSSYGGNRWAAWAEVTPLHRALVEKILEASRKMDVIFCMRTKTAWDTEATPTGGLKPVRVGLAPIQREGIEYEPDISIVMSVPDHVAAVDKTRFAELDGVRVQEPGEDFIRQVLELLDQGVTGEAAPSPTLEAWKAEIGVSDKPAISHDGKAKLEFWRAVRRMGISREEAKELLAAHGPEEALKILEERSEEKEVEG